MDRITEVVENTERLVEILNAYRASEDSINIVDLDAWVVGDLIDVQVIVDAELQRRYDETDTDMVIEYDEDDGQPSWGQEWYDFDPDC